MRYIVYINIKQNRADWAPLSYCSFAFEKLVILFCILTAHLDFSYIFFMISINFPLKFSDSSLAYIPSCHTESYAFLESMRHEETFPFLTPFVYLFMSVFKLKAWSVVL